MSGTRGMPTLGCGFHLGGNQLDYSGDASEIKIIYMQCELGSVIGLCRCTLNVHNPVDRALDCTCFSFGLQPVPSKSLFLFTFGNRPVFSLAAIL